MMEIPIKLFIGWLVLQAAKADKEPEPDIPLLPDLRKQTTARCPGCGRFTLPEMRARKIEFCAPACFEAHYNRNVPERLLLESHSDAEQQGHTDGDDRRPCPPLLRGKVPQDTDPADDAYQDPQGGTDSCHDLCF